MLEKNQNQFFFSPLKKSFSETEHNKIYEFHEIYRLEFCEIHLQIDKVQEEEKKMSVYQRTEEKNSAASFVFCVDRIDRGASVSVCVCECRLDVCY